MKFGPSDNADRPSAFQMAAMVDVVFILLAFFVMASQFRLPERDFSMGYSRSGPPAEGAAPEDFPSHIPVRLRSCPAGVAITIGQARLGDNDFDGIRAKLAEINMPELGVRILGESRLRVGHIFDAVDAVLASPMKNVSWAAIEPPAAPGRPGDPNR